MISELARSLSARLFRFALVGDEMCDFSASSECMISSRSVCIGILSFGLINFKFGHIKPPIVHIMRLCNIGDPNYKYFMVRDF